jgi:hypothetical protein
MMTGKRLSDWDVSQKTKKNCLSILSSVLDFAECNPNPAKPIKIRRKPKAEIDRYLLEKILQHYKLLILKKIIGVADGS